MPMEEKIDLTVDGWQSRYDDGKTGWDRGESNPMLMRWLKIQTLTPCRILVPGCGRGHEVITLAAAGFDVTAVDFATSAVDHLRDELDRRSLKATVIQSDLFALDHHHCFDAIYEQTCLCAIDPNRWGTYEQLLACWVKPGGQLFAMFMQTDKQEGPPFGCDLPTMQTLFGSSNWDWMGDPVEVSHPTGMHEMGSVLTRQESK